MVEKLERNYQYILKYRMNFLFIHTEEAVWKMPKNYQERNYR